MKARVLAAVLAAMLVPAPASAARSTATIAEGKGLRLLGGTSLTYAEDVAITEVGGRTLAVAISLTWNKDLGDVKVVDVTDPARPRVRWTAPCDGNLLDASATSTPGVVALVVFGGNDCLDTKDLSLVLVDVSSRRGPVVTARAELEPSVGLPDVPRDPFPRAGYSVAGHPAAPYVYTTRHDQGRGEVIAWRADAASGLERAGTVELPGQPRDLDVGNDGALLAAALGQTFATVDLTDPGAPVLSHVTHCPGCSVVSQVAFAGGLGLVVSDESANPVGCPSGSLFFYTLELGAPVLYSMYNASQIEPDPSEPTLPRVCYATDLDVSPNGRLALLTWHRNSVRVLYIGSAFGVGATGTGSGRVIEVGWFRLASTWASAARFVNGLDVVALDQNWGFNTLRLEPCAYRFAC